MKDILQRCAMCSGLQGQQYMTLVSGVWHCQVCTTRVLYYEAQPEPTWMKRRRLSGMPAKDYTNSH